MRGKQASNLPVGHHTGEFRRCGCVECRGIIATDRAREKNEARRDIAAQLADSPPNSE